VRRLQTSASGVRYGVGHLSRQSSWIVVEDDYQRHAADGVHSRMPTETVSLTKPMSYSSSSSLGLLLIWGVVVVLQSL